MTRHARFYCMRLAQPHLGKVMSTTPTLSFSKKRRYSSPPDDDAEESTDTKLALLLSLHPNTPVESLLEILLASNGSVSTASSSLSHPRPSKQARQQSSLSTFVQHPADTSVTTHKIRTPRKGETLHLYTPDSVASAVCPTELLQSFLPASLATSLLQELLKESKSFPPPLSFRLFEREVTSPHTFGFFLRDPASEEGQYHSYQSRPLAARAFSPSMVAATEMVEEAVRAAIARRYPGKRPWGMSNQRWQTNAALVNRYEGAKQAVGWHTDEVTYLGPMSVIAGLSLGVEREFRVRRVAPSEPGRVEGKDEEKEGAYAIHLPHNSLLIMHAGMQEGWKHCIHPASKVDLNPVSGDVRINITYRCYRPSLKPEKTPKCLLCSPEDRRRSTEADIWDR
jgi:alkylated DNA repair dioxygenase AlkB